VTFDPLPTDWRYRERRTISARASSGLRVTITSVGSCAPVAGVPGLFEATGVGACRLTASQPGDNAWQAAPAVDGVAQILRAAASISGFENTTYEYLGVRTFQLHATSTSGVAVRYENLDNDCGVAAGSTLDFQGTSILPKTCQVRATADPTGTYEGATLERSFTLNPTNMTIGVAESGRSSGSVRLTVTFNHPTQFFAGVESGGCGLDADESSSKTQHAMTVSSAAPPETCRIRVGNSLPDGSVKYVFELVDVTVT
jgi:hypothetical protein